MNTASFSAPRRLSLRLAKRFASLCCIAATLVPLASHAAIQVVDATYGPNCGAAAGNATVPVAGQCNGKNQCDYAVDFHALGDPTPGCAKTFVARWTCSPGAAVHTASVAAEAGLGSHVNLACISVLPPGVADRPPGSLELLKIDPNPVAVNGRFAIVARVRNNRAKPLLLVLDAKTSYSPDQPITVDLTANETRVVSLIGSYSSGGDHDLALVATWQTDKTRLVPNGPTGVQRVPVFEPLDQAVDVVHVLATTPRQPQFVDLGPNQLDEVNGKALAAGVVSSIVGASNDLFAIPKTGGVWRSRNGGPWTYLPNSPPRAFSIAVDPTLPTHLVVGERPDDTSDARIGASGLWESIDSGNTWAYTFNPASLGVGQEIPAVAISRKTATVLVATSAGVSRRPRGGNNQLLYVPFTAGFRDRTDQGCQATNGTTPLGRVTAVTASETRLWARTSAELFWSDDDGITWKCWRLRETVDLPGAPGTAVRYDTVGKSQPDQQSLAAFDDQAFVIFAGAGSSATGLLTFSPATRTLVAQYTGDNDGRGLGGRRFVRAFTVDASTCPVTSGIGGSRQVFVSASQSIQQATGVGTDSRLNFDPVLGSKGSGPPNDDRFHSDIWEFWLPTDFCTSKTSVAYIGNDGGVYMGNGSGTTGRITQMSWQTHSQGLRAHTAQMVSVYAPSNKVLPPPASGQPPGIASLFDVGYPTQDNDSWWRRPNGEWVHSSLQGDSNFFAGDWAFGTAFSWRQLQSGDATLFVGSQPPTDFTLNRPTLDNQQPPQNDNQPLDGPGAVQAVQSLVSDGTPTALDVVMLAQLPLPAQFGAAVADPKGGTGTGKRMAILRNKSFDTADDGPATSFAGWSIINDAIPTGPRRLWVSGGRSNPRYFLYTDQNNAQCSRGLQRLDFSAGAWTWTCLITNLLAAADTVAPNSDERAYFGSGTGRQQGPAFVNPFDPQVFLAAVDANLNATPPAPASLQITLDGGTHFCQLPILTALVTESGRYPIVDAVYPRFGEVLSAFHGNPLSVPSAVAFNPQQPAQILVGSPYTGLYLGSVSKSPIDPGRCGERWNDLTPALPRARAYISGAAFATDAAVVSTEGRGVYGITNLASARSATFFAPNAAPRAGGVIASLKQGNGAVVPWAAVSLAVWNAASLGTVDLKQSSLRTDETGALILSTLLPAGSYVVDARFAGDPQLSPAKATWVMAVN